MKSKIISFIFIILFFIVIFYMFHGNNQLNDNEEDSNYLVNETINNPKRNNIKLKILVIEINPKLNSIANTPKVSTYFNQDPDKTLNEIIKDFKETSHNYLDFDVQREYLDEFPTYKEEVKLVNGKSDYRYDEETFLERANHENSWYQYIKNDKVGKIVNYSFDYEYIINKYDLINKKKNNEFDHVWLLTMDPVATYETIMVGRNSYYVNGPSYVTDCDNFIIGNISFSRRDANLHAFAHAIENILRASFNRDYLAYTDYTDKSFYREYNTKYNSYQKNAIKISSEEEYNKLNYFEKYMLNIYSNKSNYSSIGNIHFPFNGEKDYDYSNKKNVKSNCLEWNNYPLVKWNFKELNSSVWLNHDINKKLTNDDNKDPDRLYTRFWLYMMPHIDGYTSDGYLNNWWHYIVSLDFVDELLDQTELEDDKVIIKKDDFVNLKLIKKYNSSKKELVDKVPIGNNIYIDDNNILDYKDGYLYGKNIGESKIKISYDGKSIEYNIKVT